MRLGTFPCASPEWQALTRARQPARIKYCVPGIAAATSTVHLKAVEAE